MTYLFDPDKNFLSLSGNILANGVVYFCVPDGTANINTLKTIYTTNAQSVQASNPQTLTASGRFPQEVHGTGYYDVVIKTGVGGATIRTLYNVQAGNRTPATVNVLDYGAAGDFAADDTAEIQAAINAAGPNGTVYFPPGGYKITSVINITEAGVKLIGAGSAATYILNAGTNNHAFHFYSPSTASVSTFLGGCGIADMYIYRASAATSGAGVQLTQCSGFQLNDVRIVEHPEGMKVKGGQLNNLKGLRLDYAGTYTDLSATVGASQLHFQETPVDGGLYQPCYTVNVSDFFIACNNKVNTCILIQNGDGLKFVNGYINLATAALLKVINGRNNAYISDVSFTNTYFDGVSVTDYAVMVPDDTFGASNVYQLQFTACDFGQIDDIGILVGKPCYMQLANCWLGFTGSWAVDYDMSSYVGQGKFIATGCMSGSTGGDLGGSGVFRLKSGEAFHVVGCQMDAQLGSAQNIQLLGTIGSAVISSNSFRGNTADIDYSTATIGSLTISGNSSQSPTAANGATGLRTGNVSITDTQTLDHYLEGTWTPGITLGGAAVGVTYTSQNAAYTRIGNRIFFNVQIVLSSKGSSTGAVLVTGLPVASGWGAHQPCSLRVTAVTSGVGDTSLMAGVTNSATTIGLFDIAGGTIAALTDADLTNTSTIEISGQYLV